MLKGITASNGNLTFEGDSPPGSTMHEVGGPEADELRRMAVFSSDLQAARQWLDSLSVSVQQVPTTTDRALCNAALIAFCCCFESTSGLRRKPLNSKKVFAGEQRQQLERLITIRNQMVAHDEQFASHTAVLVVKSADHIASETLTYHLSFSLVAMNERKILNNLVDVALKWVRIKIDKLSKEITTAFNKLPLDQRSGFPAYSLQIVEGDPFRKK